MCIHIYEGVNSEPLSCGTSARWGAPLSWRRVSPTLVLAHSHTHTGTGLTRLLPQRCALPPGQRAEAEGLRALPHCRSEAHAGLCSPVGCRGLCGFFVCFSVCLGFLLVCFVFFFYFLGFALAVSRVHPPLPTAGTSRARHAARPRGRGRLSLESPGPSLCRAAAARSFTCPNGPAARSPRGVRPRRFPRR